jgi:MFS family permease
MSRPRGLLTLASVAVAFAAADTYVVVLCLPDMMGSVGLSIDELQRAAPILSGFLLGYVAMLPLIGRIADVRGRLPVLTASLVLFALGSLVTAASYDLGSLVAGRFLQGVGGGGLVPVTLALVADLYPVERRSVPLGVVNGVQEFGSVVGPLYGALILAIGDWRDIFWVNLAVAAALAVAVDLRAPRTARRRPDWIGAVLFLALVGAVLLVMRQPTGLITSVRWGGPFVPFGDSTSVWWSPLGVATAVLGGALVLWLLLAPRAYGRHLVDLRGWWASTRQADLPGAVLLAIVLGGVILAFATADPQVQVFSAAGPWCLAVSALALVAFIVHARRTPRPLVPRDAFRGHPAVAAMVVSLFVGAALIAALTDIPIFARATVYSDSQLRAALVLVEFLVALPIGAVAGGLFARRLPHGLVAAAGLALAAVGFVLMAGWGQDALHHLSATAVLALTGLGFGLALAPVNATLLAHTAPDSHGVTSALLVVARMVGMLVGISALTTIGLRRYYAVEADIPSPHAVCGGLSTRCSAYTDLLQHAAIEQLQAVFLGAAACALIGAGVAAVGFGRRGARPLRAADVEHVTK